MKTTRNVLERWLPSKLVGWIGFQIAEKQVDSHCLNLRFWNSMHCLLVCTEPQVLSQFPRQKPDGLQKDDPSIKLAEKLCLMICSQLKWSSHDGKGGFQKLFDQLKVVTSTPHRVANLIWRKSNFDLCMQYMLVQGWAGKAFWLPGTGREIENHIPVLREGNGN